MERESYRFPGSGFWLRAVTVKCQDAADFCNGGGRVGWCFPKCQKAGIFIRRIKKYDSFPHMYQLIHRLLQDFVPDHLTEANKNR